MKFLKLKAIDVEIQNLHFHARTMNVHFPRKVYYPYIHCGLKVSVRERKAGLVVSWVYNWGGVRHTSSLLGQTSL